MSQLSTVEIMLKFRIHFLRVNIYIVKGPRDLDLKQPTMGFPKILTFEPDSELGFKVRMCTASKHRIRSASEAATSEPGSKMQGLHGKSKKHGSYRLPNKSY